MNGTNVTPRQLRSFAWITSGMFVLVFTGIPWAWGGKLHAWPLVVALVLSGWGLLAPASLKPVYGGWMRLAAVLGAINNRLLLGILYFGMLLPIGLLMRLVRRDPLRRKYDGAAASYRITKAARDRNHFERPY